MYVYMCIAHTEIFFVQVNGIGMGIPRGDKNGYLYGKTV